MSKSTSKKSAAGKGSPLLVGLLLGLILGVGMAAILAWYLMKSPTPFVNKEATIANKAQHEEQTKAAASAVVKQNTPAASAVVNDGKPRFEFYKVLTDKQDGSTLPGQAAPKPLKQAETAKPVEAAKPVAEAAKPAAKQIYFLQAGAFANEAEAEKLKASLIMEGMEVTVLAMNSPDKGTLHRVRTGPYQSADEMNAARAKLQLKGVTATPIHVQ